ncbi:MAG: SPW repeat protein [Patescibacteria group bacterium]|nr:SPW repeat protein [Patescibacteria group bacterium]
MWQDWVNGILGLWIIVVPFIGLTGASLVWTLAVTGIVIAVLGFWSGAQQSTSAV